MPEIKLNRQAAASGQLPNVCLCCGAPATQFVLHKFYLRSTGILIAMLLLGKMRWLFLPQSYEFSELRVPLCGFHRHRLSLHTYLLIGFAVLGLLCVPVLLIGSINKDYLWVTEIGLVLFLLLFPVMFFTVLTVMILTPRMVEHSTMSITLVSVSSGFAQALGSGGMPGITPGAGFSAAKPLPGLPAQPQASGPGLFAGFNLTVGLVTALTCALSLMEFGVIFYGRALITGSVTRLNHVNNQSQWDEQARRIEENRRRQQAEFERQMAEANRRMQAPPVGPPPVMPPPFPNTPSPPPYSPPPAPTPRPPATPSSDPDHWDNVRRWKSESGIELGRGRLVSRDGDYITIAYRRSTPTLRERRLPIRSLSVEDQAFVRSQFPDPPPSSPQLTGETRPGGKLSPTNENNRNFVPPPTGTKPGYEVTSTNQVKAGDKIHIFWSSTWYRGVVLGTDYGLIKVHYDNEPDHWDELASLQRVRAVSSTGASSPAPTPSLPTPSPPPLPEAPPAEMRTWTDSTGKFKLDAKLIAVENGNVKLERPDGKIVTMPLDKLSPADQVIVRAKFP